MTAQGEDQRARILRSIVEVVAEQGYLRAKIAQIAAGAGVSRATFYEQFESKEQCFLEALRLDAESTRRQVAGAVRAATPERTAEAALTALASLAREQPHVFDCLTHEATLAGQKALAQRERLLAELAAIVDQRSGRSRAPASEPDMPARILLGAALRTLGMSMRRGDQDPARTLEELVAWSELYRVPAGARRWTRIAADPALLSATHDDIANSAFAPAGWPRGRQRVPAALVRRAQRERILHATAVAVSQEGYGDTTVADIVSAAGLSRDVFYTHLRGRRDALEQAARLFYEQSIGTMAGAFFTAPEPWAERVWSAGLALSELLAGAPAFTRLAYIDAYAPDQAAARRTDEMFLSFGVFLEPGRSEDRHATLTAALASAAVTSALIETVVQLIASNRLAELPGLVALGAYLALTPHVGVEPANELVERKLAELAHKR
jgi:AcrR family transcriptional regulator